MGSRRVTGTDLGLAALLLLFGLYGTGPAAANQGQVLPPVAYLLVVAACLPIAVRRWRPVWTFALTGAATMTYVGLGYAYGPILFALVVACYGLAVRSSVRRAVTGTAVLLAASVAAVGAGIASGERQWPDFINVAAWLVIPAAVGVAVKVRRDAVTDVRAEQARRAISEERLQLAQEVHDVVGHGLAVIAMQAGVALRLVDRDPVRTRAALEAIRATSTEALDGLRAELDALRHTPDLAHPRLRPTAGLADLPGLAERISSSGLPVAVDLADSAGDLPADVDLAGYRIVQESLTNVLRHAGPGATAQVRIARHGGTLHIEVLDTGRGAAAAGARGHGIDGMRARAEALGGTLDAGPRPGGGFAVRARLPAAAAAPTTRDSG